MEEEKILSAEKQINQDEDEVSLRPKTLNEYVGQKEIKENLKIAIEAAKKRDESLDHILLYGPPGLGKTTLAYIIANEMGSNIKTTSGPSIERPGDLASILSTIEEGDVLFIDEIHRLPKVVEEVLYPAMEDYCIDVVVGKDNESRSIRINLPPFTLVGATTRAGQISSPLRDRFGIIGALEYYDEEDLTKIVKRTSKVYETTIPDESAIEIAKRSRGTPRIANRLFKRIRDYADVLNDGTITLDVARMALDKLRVDEKGLDSTDIRYLRAIIERFKGGPVGVETIASSISEEVVTIEDVVEPYLLQIGFINRTARGRMATAKAYEHLAIPYTEGLF